jgi:hypothetical protein
MFWGSRATACASASPQTGQAWVFGCRPAILAGKYVLIKKENLVGNQSSIAQPYPAATAKPACNG